MKLLRGRQKIFKFCNFHAHAQHRAAASGGVPVADQAFEQMARCCIVHSLMMIWRTLRYPAHG
jgi:hypothetical protein